MLRTYSGAMYWQSEEIPSMVNLSEARYLSYTAREERKQVSHLSVSGKNKDIQIPNLTIPPCSSVV